MRARSKTSHKSAIMTAKRVQNRCSSKIIASKHAKICKSFLPLLPNANVHHSCAVNIPSVIRDADINDIQSRSRMSRPKSFQVSQRTVPAFTVQSLQKNTTVCRPPTARIESSGAQQFTTSFRKHYQRGDFPLMIEHRGRSNKIAWKANLGQLDYGYYLPLFFDGLCETRHPYSFLAKQGTCDLIENDGQQTLAVLPQLIGPIRRALNTRNAQVVTTTLHVLQKMVQSSVGMGEALVPYYRQILPILNMFRHRNINTGDGIVYGQLKRELLGDLIQNTLEILEWHGGPDAYFHIKYMIPTYESCRAHVKSKMATA